MNQVDLEETMRARGLTRLDREWEGRRKRKDVTGDRKVRSLIDYYSSQLSVAIAEFMERSLKGKAGRNATVALDFEGWSPDVLAVATCSAVFNGLCLGETATRTALDLGQILEDHERMTKFIKENRGAQKWVEREIKRRKINNKKHKRLYYYHVAKLKGIDLPKWSKQRRLRMGMTLVELFCETTRLAKITLVRFGRKTYSRFESTPQIMAWVDSSREDRALFRPVALPMIEKPKGWDSLNSGGYLNIESTLVKFAEHKTGQPELLASADLSNVYLAVNALDSTAFRVNRRVLSVMQYFFAMGVEVGTLSSGQLLEIPPMPEEVRGDIKQLTEKQKEIRKAWRKSARALHEQNTAMQSNRLQAMRVLDLAEEFKDFEKIYFPHQLDFRGRVYDMPAGLNPQGPDYARSLLEFGVGKKVTTKEALTWHMVHGANCWGYDKVSMADRVQWVKDNFENIRAVAADPKANAWWHDADKPWAFLAWCFDYMDVLKGEPSHIAVAMDGSCNGLQHLSAMLRDPVGAEAVNLVPGSQPNDIYARVADVVIEDLKKDRRNKRWAREWLASGIIDRKLCKRSVMVMPYGGTMTSTMRYVEESVRDKLDALDLTIMFGDDQVKAIIYLAGLVHNATRKVVKAAAEVMKWLQEIANIAAQEGVHIHWTTPHGFVAKQSYIKYARKRFDLIIDGARRTSQIVEPTTHIDTQRSRNSVSPNFVHSLDACAMMMTVNKALALGVKNFRMVHDDYGTHAADTPVLAKCLREAFVELYRDNDVLKNFRDEVKKQIPKERHKDLPKLLKKGKFKIEDVLTSEFFFA